MQSPIPFQDFPDGNTQDTGGLVPEEGMQINAGFDCCLDNGGLVLAAFTLVDNDKRYEAYQVNFADKTIKYLLPSEVKYGFSSVKEYLAAYHGKDIAPIGIQTYCDAFQGNLYYVWEGNLRIIRVNIRTGEITTFGQKTQNYIRPKVTNSLVNAYEERDKKNTGKRSRS